MTELLRAGLYRLRRSPLFWLGCAGMALYILGAMASTLKGPYYPATDDWMLGCLRADLDGVLFHSLLNSFYVTSVVCAAAMGREYQDGGLRRMVIVGHRRRDMYLCNLLLSVITCAAVASAGFLPGLVLEYAVCGSLNNSLKELLLYAAGMFLASAAMASFLTLLGMLIPNRTASIIASLLLSLALIMAGKTLDNWLDEPQTSLIVTDVTEDGEWITEEIPNPDCLPEGPGRDAVQFLVDFDPGAQAFLYATFSAFEPERLMACDVLFFALTSATGLLLFRRKELR